MSIARDEAERRYRQFPVTTDVESMDYQQRLFQDKAENLLRGQLRIAYVLGRTEDPTEAEIESAAKALMKFETNWAKPHVTDSDIEQLWSSQFDEFRENYRKKAGSVLEAARKAVAE